MLKTNKLELSDVQDILLTDKSKVEIEKSMYNVLPLPIILICYQGKYKYILGVLYKKEKKK